MHRSAKWSLALLTLLATERPAPDGDPPQLAITRLRRSIISRLFVAAKASQAARCELFQSPQ